MGGTPNPTQGFEYKLADGTVVKAENIEEAFKTVAKMKEDTAAALRESRGKTEEMEQRLNAMQQEITRAHTPPPDPQAFNRDQYYRLVGEDPIQAQNYLDAYRFGIPDPGQVVGYFQNMNTTVNSMQQNLLAASFISNHPDFPQDVKSANTLTQEVIRLNNEGHPVNMDTLDLAWRNCLDSDAIKPLEAPEETVETVNPSLGGSGAATIDAESARIEEEVLSGKMTTADFEKYMKSKGML